MTEININTGKFIEIIKNNSTSSIRGVVDPHFIELSKFLFLDDDLDSYIQLKSFNESNDKVDQISFFFGLATIGLSKKISDINPSDTVKSIKFSNNDYKKILQCVYDFIINPNNKTFEKIKSFDLLDYEIDLCIYFCLYYSELDYLSFLKFYPTLNDFFTYDNNLIYLQDNRDINDLLDNYGLIIIGILTKYYSLFDKKTYKSVSATLIKELCFNTFILDRYLSFNVTNRDLILSIFNLLESYYSFLPQKFTLLISHYFLLNSYLYKDFNYINNWFNQFSEKIISEDLKKDFEGNFNWNISDKRIEPNIYYLSEKNAYFYINSIFSLCANLNGKNLVSNSDNLKNNLNIIGGLNSLPFLNLDTDSFFVNISFHYVDRFNFHNNYLFLNNNDNEMLKDKNSTILIIPDIEMFIDKDINITLEAYINDIIKISRSNNILFQTLPYPSLLSHVYLKEEKLFNLVQNFNNLLKSLEKNKSFKVLDINNYLLLNNKYTDLNNLICNYYIKPDILRKLFYNEFIEK